MLYKGKRERERNIVIKIFYEKDRKFENRVSAIIHAVYVRVSNKGFINLARQIKEFAVYTDGVQQIDVFIISCDFQILLKKKINK